MSRAVTLLLVPSRPGNRRYQRMCMWVWKRDGVHLKRPKTCTGGRAHTYIITFATHRQSSTAVSPHSAPQNTLLYPYSIWTAATDTLQTLLATRTGNGAIAGKLQAMQGSGACVACVSPRVHTPYVRPFVMWRTHACGYSNT